MADQSARNLKSTVDLMNKEISTLQGAKVCVLLDAFNSLTARGLYMTHRLFLLHSRLITFLMFCLLTTFDSSKCSSALQLE
jgi:hypothetical protein